MKKLTSFLAVMLILLSVPIVCHAGSVPEDLLNADSAQVYFGEVKSVDDGSITVIQKKSIKGEFVKDRELIYQSFAFTDSPETGTTYLCGYFDENNPLYVWEITGTDTKTMTLQNTDDMSKRMQEYLNKGEFEEKEKERLAGESTKDEPETASGEPVTAVISESPGAALDARGMENSYPMILALCGAILIGAIFFIRIKGKNRP